MPAARIVALHPDQWARSAADYVAELIVRLAESAGRCTLALAGGGTPRAVYAVLGRSPFVERIPWRAIEVFFSDERGVPPDHRDSNFRMASDVLLDRVPVPRDQVHRMEAERADLEAAAAEYARVLPDPMDVVLLGMGVDGHTASLFPGHPALLERRRRVVPVTGNVPVAPRLTITAPVIGGAAEVVVLVAGAEKAATVARALEGPLDIGALPVQLARDRVWILDAGAATALRRRSA